MLDPHNETRTQENHQNCVFNYKGQHRFNYLWKSLHAVKAAILCQMDWFQYDIILIMNMNKNAFYIMNKGVVLWNCAPCKIVCYAIGNTHAKKLSWALKNCDGS